MSGFHLDLSSMRKDPAAFLKDLKKSGQPKNGLTISILLDTCGSLEHWPSLRDAGIIEMVQNVAISAEAREVIYGLDAYTKCMELIWKTEDKSVRAHYQAVTDALRLARAVCVHVWHGLKNMPTSVGDPLREGYRLAIQEFVHNLTLLQPEYLPGSGDEDDDEDDENDEFGNGEMLFMNLILTSPIYTLATHCWLFAPDSKTRRRSADIRECVMDLDLDDACSMDAEHYIKEDIEPKKAISQLDMIIKTRDGTETHLVEALRLIVAVLTHHTVKLRVGLEADLVAVLWGILKSGAPEVRARPDFSANGILDKLLEQSSSPIRVLNGIITNHNGAKLMARMAVVAAKDWSLSKDRSIFLVTQILKHIGDEKTRSPAARNLALVTQEKLRPVWLETLTHLRTFSVKKHPDAKAVIEKWNALGVAVGLDKLVKPLVGCSWYMCPLYEEQTEKRMSMCTKCQQVQYCDKTCQRQDWKEGGHREMCREATKTA